MLVPYSQIVVERLQNQIGLAVFMPSKSLAKPTEVVA